MGQFKIELLPKASQQWVQVCACPNHDHLPSIKHHDATFYPAGRHGVGRQIHAHQLLTVQDADHGQTAGTAALVQQHALDPTQPGLSAVLDSILTAVERGASGRGYHGVLGRAVERVVVDRLMELAQGARNPEVRAVAQEKLRTVARRAGEASERAEDAIAAIRAGARAVVFKRFAIETLMDAIRGWIGEVDPDAAVAATTELMARQDTASAALANLPCS